MTAVYIVVMFIHIIAAIAWVGGMAYLRFVLLPGLGRTSPQVRGPMLAEVAQPTVRFLLRSAEITILFGLANFILLGGASHSRTWQAAIGLGLLISIIIYGLGQAVTRPTTMRLVEAVRSVQPSPLMGRTGPTSQNAAAQIPSLAAKQRTVLNAQFGLAVLVALTMAAARFV